MEFDEIIVKESPGLCRCCLSEGCYKDLGSEYTWMNETEVYADMLLECFDIGISQHNDGPNGPNRLICEVCITRLRDACNFKKQVLDSEKKFVDMVGRGEFRPKVMVYQAMMKAETLPEEALVEDGEVEYLDEIFEEEPLKSDDVAPEASVSDDISLAALAKGKRGRPKKNSVKSEKKVKVAKLDDKPKTSRTVTRGILKKTLTPLETIHMNKLIKLQEIKQNKGLIPQEQTCLRERRCVKRNEPMKEYPNDEENYQILGEPLIAGVDNSSLQFDKKENNKQTPIEIKIKLLKSHDEMIEQNTAKDNIERLNQQNAHVCDNNKKISDVNDKSHCKDIKKVIIKLDDELDTSLSGPEFLRRFRERMKNNVLRQERLRFRRKNYYKKISEIDIEEKERRRVWWREKQRRRRKKKALLEQKGILGKELSSSVPDVDLPECFVLVVQPNMV